MELVIDSQFIYRVFGKEKGKYFQRINSIDAIKKGIQTFEEKKKRQTDSMSQVMHTQKPHTSKMSLA